MVAVICVVVVVVDAAGWFPWLPNWRPALDTGERYGIDVSHHQGTIDWSAVAGDGITFAYVKASEGGDWVDESFADNWAGAGEAGLDRGVYHFFSLCTPGAVQARHFLGVLPPEENALAPALDLELGGNCAARPAAEEVRAEVVAFLRLVEEAWGKPVLLYVGVEFEDVYPVRADLDRPLWDLRFFFRPNVEGWHIWQLHGFANVAGVDGRVDLDIMREG
ncbi:MAG: lysozyme M1 (1,4-beta-N-acetylmuramidase) [Actinophytocola sp.]|nr:lysozyme M1 (1,4-beta-N-acetylmuramidase) [Actinophytocola sp.]